MDYGWGYQGMGGGWWVLMMAGMVIFWAIVVFGIVALVRHNLPGPGSNPLGDGTEKAVAIINERLARGEITQAEYATLLAVLRDRS